MNILKKLKENHVLLLVVPTTQYADLISSVIRGIAGKNICYVSLNKTVEAIKESLKKEKISDKNFYFIDCITKTIKPAEDTAKFMFVSSPSSLTELSITLEKAAKILPEKHIVFFDSLSTLLIYYHDDIATHFVHNLINKMRENNLSAVLTILKKDMDTDFGRDVSMLVDKTIELD